jgi:predicted DNA-binding transcriptional regulator AlpA
MATVATTNNYPPRGLRHGSAADYVGMKPTKFDAMVEDGRMPKPRRVDGVVVWDRLELDRAFDELPHTNETAASIEDQELQSRLEAFEHG